MSVTDSVRRGIYGLNPGQLFHRIETAMQDYPDAGIEVLIYVNAELATWLESQPPLRRFILTSASEYCRRHRADVTGNAGPVTVNLQGKPGVQMAEIEILPAAKLLLRAIAAPLSNSQRALIVLEGPMKGTAMWWSDDRIARRPLPAEVAANPDFWIEPEAGLERFLAPAGGAPGWNVGSAERVYGHHVLYDEVNV